MRSFWRQRGGELVEPGGEIGPVVRIDQRRDAVEELGGTGERVRRQRRRCRIGDRRGGGGEEGAARIVAARRIQHHHGRGAVAGAHQGPQIGLGDAQIVLGRLVDRGEPLRRIRRPAGGVGDQPAIVCSEAVELIPAQRLESGQRAVDVAASEIRPGTQDFGHHRTEAPAFDLRELAGRADEIADHHPLDSERRAGQRIAREHRQHRGHEVVGRLKVAGGEAQHEAALDQHRVVRIAQQRLAEIDRGIVEVVVENCGAAGEIVAAHRAAERELALLGGGRGGGERREERGRGEDPTGASCALSVAPAVAADTPHAHSPKLPVGLALSGGHNRLRCRARPSSARMKTGR